MSKHTGWPYGVTKKDLRVEFYKGGGPGGQHRNKKSVACRITHVPTGLSAQCEDERSQRQNRKRAFMRLAEQLVPLMKAELQAVNHPPPSNERIRTYHEPDQRVQDHRLPGMQWRYSDVLGGKAFAEIVDALCEREAGH